MARLRTILRRLASDRRGVVAATFALSAMLLVVAVGSGIDLQRTYIARQQLSAIAALTCQYSNRPMVVMLAFGSGGTASYVSAVNSFYAVARDDQNPSWTQTNASPFTYAAGGAGNIALAATVPTTIMHVIGVTTMPISASAQCFTALTSLPQPVPDSTATMLVNDGFENATYNVTWYLPSGTIKPYSNGSTTNPVANTAPATAGYVGTNGNEWIVMGYCLEIDLVGKTETTVPQGTHNAELDCDNGSNSVGNSSISTKAYMVAGSYELRWDYAGRIPNTYYGTSYICGTTAADTSWANDTSYTYGANTYGSRTNQINVYLDQNTTGSPPTHTTIDGTQTLGGSNLIDECVYSSGWIERSVLITVTTAGYYWLSIAADGSNDSYGGDIDNIRLCVGTCPGNAGDDFPTAWLPSGSTNVLLFEDTFETPTYTGTYYNLNGNLGLSIGTSSYWGEAGQGWGIAAINQLPYWTSGCPQGTQCVEIGWHDTTNSTDVGFAKPFLLDPGYYQVTYDYVSENTFTGLSGVYCGGTPTAARVSTLTGGSGTGTDRVNGANHGTLSWGSGLVGVFMVSAQLASEPNPSTTFGATTTYTSKTGATESSPSVPSNSISLTSYNPSQNNPLLDICGYAATAQTRTSYVQIQKPALYWLVFSILGTYTAFGAQIDDVKITALGSPRMTSPPGGAIQIPVPTPQPGSTLYFTGFWIPADVY